MKINLLLLLFFTFLILFMENNSGDLKNNVNDPQIEMIKSELSEFGFLREHIDLALKLTSDKQEAIDL